MPGWTHVSVMSEDSAIMTVADQAVGSLTLPSQPTYSPLADAFRRLLRNRMSLASGIFIIILVLVAILADVINPYVVQGFGEELERSGQPAYAKQVLRDNYALPGEQSKSASLEGFIYILGADQLGRDLLTRTMYGARVSLSVALIAAAVSLTIGITYGLISGYAGGRVDDVQMRIVDFLYGIPIIIVVILMQVYFKALDRSGGGTGLVGAILDINRAAGGLLFVFIAIGALNWIGMARIARGQTLSYKKKEFVEAALSVGSSTPRIIFRHLLPNILGPCIVQETLQIPGYILTEAFLSFIGLGVNPPTPSWGIMIQEGYQALRSAPHVILVPAAALFFTVLAFNFLGDGLRDAFDPRLRGMT
jgi:ABC-type dipeptide/oligopeptide/nickel transport system permease subunit